jgi:DNA-binding CsgD family transcriptional regulator
MLIDALANVPAQRGAADRASTLTSAERAVLDRLSRGLTSKEIAAAFGRSRYTIDTQVKSIVRKFGCSGRSEAVYLARRLGILD